MLRIVLDTDVIIAAMRSSTGASAAILDAALENQFQLLTSVPLALEYEAKCTLPEHYQPSGLTQAQALSYVNTIVTISEPVNRRFFWRPQLRDPEDEMVLETAINGRADILATFNHRHYQQIPKRFGIELLLPAQTIWRIREWQ
ncbi:MAG: putative toxin-antitoxin system toxin component, PIN family [Chloroflexota bacterium]